MAWVKDEPEIRSQKHKERKNALAEVRKYHREIMESEKEFEQWEDQK